MNNKLLIITALSMSILGGAYSEEETSTQEILLSGKLYFPGDDEIYGAGYGADLQVRFWNESVIGWSLAAGGAYWEANEGYEEDGFGNSINIKGNVTMFPVGASFLFKPEVTDSLNILLEAGIRYVFVQSNASAVFDGPLFTPSFTTEVEIDNGIIAVFGLNLEYELTDSISLVGGAGLQADLQKGDVKMGGIETGDNELKSTFIQAGLSFSF